MSNRNPHDMNDPSHVPHYPDWPNGHFHPDWPHNMRHRWNDSEPANLVPFDHDCCHHDEREDCVCVTSADAELWNSLSSLSALSAIEPSAISALSAFNPEEFSALSGLVYEYSEIWTSAQYVPNIYENLNLLFSAMNNKVDINEIYYTDETGKRKPKFLDGIYAESEYFWGDGTEDHVLKPSKQLKAWLERLRDAITNSRGEVDGILATGEQIVDLKNDINTLYQMILQGGGGGIPVTGDIFTAHFVEATSYEDAMSESTQNPDVFYYYAESDVKQP